MMGSSFVILFFAKLFITILGYKKQQNWPLDRDNYICDTQQIIP